MTLYGLTKLPSLFKIPENSASDARNFRLKLSTDLMDMAPKMSNLAELANQKTLQKLKIARRPGSNFVKRKMRENADAMPSGISKRTNALVS